MSRQWIYHDSQDSFFRYPFGAVSCNTQVDLKLEIYVDNPVQEVILRLWKNNQEEKIVMQQGSMDGTKIIYQAQITAPPTPLLLWYYFMVVQDGRIYHYGNNSNNTGGVGQIYEHQPPSYQITVYKEGIVTPNWFKDAVIYQIFVDRFYNEQEEGQLLNPQEKCHVYYRWHDSVYYKNCSKTRVVNCFDFFGGNLTGVIKKLSYLKELGVNVICFNPLFEAPSNHKHDTINYKKIDSMYGDNKIFQELCQKAKEMGIAVVLDGVFSYTGSDSIYFNREGNHPELGAYQSKDSPYYSWYRFEEHPHKYDCRWEMDILPNVNGLDPAYQRFIIHDQGSVLEYWMKMGAKGWRLDIADELPSPFIKAFQKKMKEIDEESVLIGEVWEDASNKISYGEMREYLLGEKLDVVTNYPFRSIILDFFTGKKNAAEVHKVLLSLYENYPKEHFYATMNLISSHDVPRALTLLGEAPPGETLSCEEQSRYFLTEEQIQLAVARLKLVSLLQMTFPGIPCIYYGDEVGVEGYGDPYGHATYPWGSEIKSLLDWHKKLIALRHKHEVLKTGQWISLNVQEDVYGYVRVIENERDVFEQVKENNVAVVLFNRNRHRKITVAIDLSKWCQGTVLDLLQLDKEVHLANGLLNISLMPLEGKLLMQAGMR